MKREIIFNKRKKRLIATDSFRQKIKRRSDKLINYFLVLYFFWGIIFAFFYNTWLIGIVGGGTSLLLYYVTKKTFPVSNFYQYVLSVILGLFMAQYIYQMNGMFELYLVAFVGSTLLITYQNWKLQIPLFIIVMIHLSFFGNHEGPGIQKMDFSNLRSYEIQRFLVHVILAALIFFICGLWGYLLKKYSAIQIIQTTEMEKLQKEALFAVKEQAAIEGNNRFNYAAQATSDAIWDRNYSEDKVFWGDGFRALFGYENNPLTTSVNFWASKVHPEDLENITAITQKDKDNPGINNWSGEYRFLKANGEYAFVREKAIILRDESGIACRTIGALQDVSEIKENEIKLKSLNDTLQSEKYYLDSLMDNMPDAIYFKDKESKFLRVSKYMVSKHLAEHPGATVNDLLGKSDIDLKDDDHAREAYRDEQEIQKTKKPKIDYIEKEIKTNGTEAWVTTSKLPLINTHGEVVGTFGISRDITNLKKLEQAQHEAQLDKAVAQGKFEIASDVMHDIGNAVVGFGSYLTRIKRMQEQNNPENLKNLVRFFEEQKEAISSAIGQAKADAVIKMLSGISQTQHVNQEEITKSINEQLNIISNIEEILNIQRQYITGRESQERKPVNLKNIINDSLSMLFASIDKTSVDISLNIADDLPPIKGDRTKLMQLLLHIVKNSIEAIEKNTTEKNICINAYTEENWLIVKVKDNGIGFDNINAAQFFKRGFTTKTNGAGQSLYNCKTIIESHEGSIDIISDGPGKGAQTTIGFKILAA